MVSFGIQNWWLGCIGHIQTEISFFKGVSYEVYCTLGWLSQYARISLNSFKHASVALIHTIKIMSALFLTDDFEMALKRQHAMM